MKFHIGTSGWVYDDWQGIFYPKGLSKAKWFEFYNRSFTTVELNNSFYHLPSEKAFATWRAKSTNDFIYAVKATRFITHLKKLRNTEESVATFLERAQILGEKLGPLLYQLPPSMHRNEAVLESFLELLPNHLHHVIEFRHESWFEEAVFDLLRRNNIGFCIYDMPGFTTPLVVSADFAYLRFHGGEQLYGSCYSNAEIREWASRIAQLGRGLTAVYVYFNNDVEGFAVKNARELAEILRELVGEDRSE